MSGDFYKARYNADLLLRGNVPPPVRSTALLIAGEAAYGMRLYGPAAGNYREIVSSSPTAPEVPRAAFQLGWAELRLGNRDAAQRTWTHFADAFPGDPRAPLAAELAAEVANQSGDTATADTLFQSVITRYPSTPYAGMARQSRALLALRQGREDEAARELDALVRSNASEVIDTRASLIEALAMHQAQADLETRLRDGSPGAAAGSGGGQAIEPVESFVARLRARRADETPYLIHGFVLVAAANRGWSDGVVDKLTGELVDAFPSYPAAPVLLTRVAASAAASGQWPVARRTYEKLLARYSGTPLGQTVRVEFAEALFRTGATLQARAQAEQAVAAGGDGAPRALLLLAQIDEAGGRRREALAAYDRLLRDYPGAKRSPQSLLAHAKLLEDLGEKERAISVYRKLLPQDDTDARSVDRETSAVAAFRIAEIFQSTGEYAGAVNLYLTAASLTAGSPAERRALLGALQCQAARGDSAAAQAVYERLLATNPEPELLATARQALGSADATSAPDRNGGSKSASPRTGR